MTFHSLHAQHYQAGTEGIKCATMPDPGLYFEDKNSFFYSDKTPGFANQLDHTWVQNWGLYEMKPGFDFFTYTQSPRFLWISNWKLLGAEYGAAVMVPFAYKEHLQPFDTILQKYWSPFGPTITSVRTLGISDIEVEPIILSWKFKHFDLLAGYAFWAPTGDYDHNKLFLLNLGNGYWTHMFTFGATWYPDADKTWAVSVVNRYEINMEQYDGLYNVNPLPSVATLGTTLGDIYTLEWAVSKTVFKGIDVGVTGYFQQQVTSTDGPTWYGPTYFDERVHVAGVGPEIKADIPSCGLGLSLRYAYEFSALDHPQGQMTTLTITKSF